MHQRPTFSALLHERKALVVPCAHDALSARLTEMAGFSIIAIAGSAALAARYAMPDIGIAGLSDMAAITRDILGATSAAVMCDGDDGYGDVKSVVRTVRLNEDLGAGALVLEDQARGEKRPGEAAAARVVSEEEIAAKLRAALGARNSGDFWIFGRTDAYGALGPEPAIKRAEMFLRLGVDGLFIAGVSERKDLERIGREFRGTPLITVAHGRAEDPTVDELRTMGFSLILYPMALLLPMCALFEKVLRSLRAAEVGDAGKLSFAGESEARKILAQALRTEYWSSIATQVVGPPPKARA